MNHPNDHDLASLRFQAAARDLEHIVRHIAARYITQQVPLTWRLLHAIEAEALADLGFASRHDAFLLLLFQRPDNLPYPETDETVDFGTSNALPAVFAFAVNAYEEAHAAAMQSAGRRAAVIRPRAWGG
ncbi:DUF2471 family protein [Paraburkholderia saeva]|jgi:Protein of unknown function (DUF2471)|uniref:Serine/threonine protein kinase n=1 Tax=Paraburkholderia saeva TaxID=2777537 RepID=A0A9N8X4N9_9BURK|nr:DUF2471 family protein [Paraburkholderia saeva]CAG4914837.1 hypothetical protein R52603_04280 [Paraburkholderia saeva]CAG4918377.1 hypothetical protein R70241_04638 [Paraburkholderia saeva]CAG4922552.1 hypothetical protein LMG31841_05201 [Paraburkholderia saeva]